MNPVLRLAIDLLDHFLDFMEDFRARVVLRQPRQTWRFIKRLHKAQGK